MIFCLVSKSETSCLDQSLNHTGPWRQNSLTSRPDSLDTKGLKVVSSSCLKAADSPLVLVYEGVSQGVVVWLLPKLFSQGYI